MLDMEISQKTSYLFYGISIILYEILKTYPLFVNLKVRNNVEFKTMFVNYYLKSFRDIINDSITDEIITEDATIDEKNIVINNYLQNSDCEEDDIWWIHLRYCAKIYNM
jgi:hypothetical protein